MEHSTLSTDSPVQLSKSQSTAQPLETIINTTTTTTNANNNNTNTLSSPPPTPSPPPTRSDSVGKIVKMESSKLLADDSDSLLSSGSGTSLDDDTLVTSSTHLLCPGSKKKVQILVTNNGGNGRTSRAKSRELASPTVVIDMLPAADGGQESGEKEEKMMNRIMMTPYMDSPHPFAMPEGCDEEEEATKRFVAEKMDTTNTIVACVVDGPLRSGTPTLTITSSPAVVASTSPLPALAGATSSLPANVLPTNQQHHHLTLPTACRGNNINNNNHNSVVVSGSVGVAAAAANRSHRPLRMASCVSVQSALSTSSSDSSLSDYPPDTPICKFCHQRAKSNDQLISPCYCKGSIRHMHCSCLMKWLDKLKKRNSRHQPLCCEICNYEYRWKKKFKSLKDWRLPPCSGNDRKWHLIFLMCALVMIISMMNLIIFGEDDNRTGAGAAAVRDKHNRGPATSLGTIRLSTHKAATTGGGGGSHNADDGGGNTRNNPSNPITLVLHSVNGTQLGTNTAWQNFTNLTVGNLTLLLGNLSFPPFHQLMLPMERQHNSSQAQHAAGNNKLPHPHVIRIGPAGSASGGGGGGNLNSLDYRPLHVGHHHHHHHHRRNYPTKPSEVILVISGCCFFITFFLGTFAQIKSEVSFYTMIIKFVHYNQQWIIEEYNPDVADEEVSTSASSPSPSTASSEPSSGSLPAQSNSESGLLGAAVVADESYVVVVHPIPLEPNNINNNNNNNTSSPIPPTDLTTTNTTTIELVREAKQVIEI